MSTETNYAPQVLTVSGLNQAVSRLLEKNIPLCWISGEVSNFTRAASGHWYFTLKDAQAQVRAVMFKTRTMSVDFLPREGEKVEVRATVTLYAPRGDYQLNVEAIRKAGLGNLYEAFLQLKQKLSQAGWFNQEHKRALPAFPTCIGIVTSPQAAALRDILITLERRAPHVHIIIYPTPVQGAGAAERIIEAIRHAGRRQECDVLIVARGGGSIEDLWAFNDEQLAYAIADCPMPVIAGIGHETDFTIADFVADLRAPTPTAAAEMAVGSQQDFLQRLEQLTLKLKRSMHRELDQENQRLDNHSRRLLSPAAMIANERLKLTGMQRQLRYTLTTLQRQASFRFMQLQLQLGQRRPDMSRQRQQLRQPAGRLQQLAQQNLRLQQQRLANLNVQLELLNPQRTLERGYAMVLDEQGQLIRQPGQLSQASQITIRLATGATRLDVRPAE